MDVQDCIEQQGIECSYHLHRHGHDTRQRFHEGAEGNRKRLLEKPLSSISFLAIGEHDGRYVLMMRSSRET